MPDFWSEDSLDVIYRVIEDNPGLDSNTLALKVKYELLLHQESQVKNALYSVKRLMDA